MAIPDPPGAPRLDGPESQSRGPDFLVVEWDLVAGATSYEVRTQSTDTDGVAVPAPASGTTASKRLAGLPANSRFDVAVRAINADGASAFGPRLRVFTRPATPSRPFLAGTAPAADDPLADAPSRQADRLVLDWEPVAAPAADLVFDSDPPRRDVTPNTPQAGLTPNTTYAIRLIARDDARGGESFPSAPRSVTTRPPTPADFLREDFDAFFEGIILGWDPIAPFPGSPAARWTITRRRESDGVVEVAGRGDIDVTSLVDLEHPKSPTFYRIRLAVGANISLPSPEVRVEGVIGSHIGLNLAPRPGQSPGLLGQVLPLGGMSLFAADGDGAEGGDAGDAGEGGAEGEVGGDEGEVGGDEGEVGGDEGEVGNQNQGKSPKGGDGPRETRADRMDTTGNEPKGEKESARENEGASSLGIDRQGSESDDGAGGDEGVETGAAEQAPNEQAPTEPAQAKPEQAEAQGSAPTAGGEETGPSAAPAPENVLVSEGFPGSVSQVGPEQCEVETGGETIPFRCEPDSTYTVGNDGNGTVIAAAPHDGSPGYTTSVRIDDDGNRTVQIERHQGSRTIETGSTTYDRHGNQIGSGDFDKVARGDIGYDPKAIDRPNDPKRSGATPPLKAPDQKTPEAAEPTRPSPNDPKAPPRPDREEKDGREPNPEGLPDAGGSGPGTAGEGEPEAPTPKEYPTGRGPDGDGRGEGRRGPGDGPPTPPGLGGLDVGRGGRGGPGGPLDGLLQGLDMVGYIPGPIGSGASLLQAGLLGFVKKDYAAAGIALAGVLPFGKLIKGARAGVKGLGSLAGKYFVRAEFKFTTKTYGHAFKSKMAQVGGRMRVKRGQVEAIGVATPSGRVYARFLDHELKSVGMFRVGDIPRNRIAQVMRETPSNTQRGNMLEKDIREVFERFFETKFPGGKHPSAKGPDLDLLELMFKPPRK